MDWLWTCSCGVRYQRDISYVDSYIRSVDVMMAFGLKQWCRGSAGREKGISQGAINFREHLCGDFELMVNKTSLVLHHQKLELRTAWQGFHSSTSRLIMLKSKEAMSVFRVNARSPGWIRALDLSARHRLIGTYAYNYEKLRSTRIVTIPKTISIPLSSAMPWTPTHIKIITIASNRSPWELFTLSFKSLSISCSTWGQLGPVL